MTAVSAPLSVVSEWPSSIFFLIMATSSERDAQQELGLVLIAVEKAGEARD